MHDIIKSLLMANQCLSTLSSVLSCKEDICRGVGSLLVYVKSLKGLAAIRDAVWDLLSTDSISQHWNTVCQRLLARPLAVWDDFLQQLFLRRLQVRALLASLLLSQFSASEWVDPFTLHGFNVIFSLTVLIGLPADELKIVPIAISQ